MTAEHERYREWAGAYVVGALDPAERAMFSAHVRDCRICSDEVAALAPLPALLASVPTDELAALGEPGHDASHVVHQAISSAAEERRAAAGRLRRWQVATSVAAGLAVLAIVAFAAVAMTGAGPGDPSGVPGDDVVAFEIVMSKADEAAVDVAPRGWGTEVYLRLDGLPARDQYVVSVTDSEGTRQQIGTWGRTPSARARITAATAIPADGLQSVMVTSADDQDIIVSSTR